jgi:hypothetical protein
MDAMLIRSPFIDEILAGTKTREFRGNATKKRGLVALVKSGTGTVVGACKITGVEGPLSAGPYRKTYGWIVEDAVQLERPVPYEHPYGAVIWVKLPENVAGKVRKQLIGTPLEAAPLATTGTSSERKTTYIDLDRLGEAKAPFDTLSRADQVFFVWRALLGQGAIERDQAVRGIAQQLRDAGRESFKRLTRTGALYRAVDGAIRHAMARDAIDKPEEGVIRAVIRKAEFFDQEAWTTCLLRVLTTNPIARDKVLRAAADEAVTLFGLKLGRVRKGGPVLRAIDEALNEATRAGETEELADGRVRLAS